MAGAVCHGVPGPDVICWLLQEALKDFVHVGLVHYEYDDKGGQRLGLLLASVALSHSQPTAAALP